VREQETNRRRASFREALFDIDLFILYHSVIDHLQSVLCCCVIPLRFCAFDFVCEMRTRLQKWSSRRSLFLTSRAVSPLRYDVDTTDNATYIHSRTGLRAGARIPNFDQGGSLTPSRPLSTPTGGRSSPISNSGAT